MTIPIKDYPAGKGPRIQLSDNAGRVSTVWKLLSGPKSPDFYIVPMMLGGAVKVSLHASGSWHVGLTQEHKEIFGITGSRHWEIWRRGSEIGPGVVRGWYLLIPDQELRFGNLDPTAIQLPTVGRDGAVSLEVLMVSNVGTELVFDQSKIIGRWPLKGSDESCLVLARRIPWPHEMQQWCEHIRAQAIAMAAVAEIQPDASHRYLFHGHDQNDVRFGIELGSLNAA